MKLPMKCFASAQTEVKKGEVLLDQRDVARRGWGQRKKDVNYDQILATGGGHTGAISSQ